MSNKRLPVYLEYRRNFEEYFTMSRGLLDDFMRALFPYLDEEKQRSGVLNSKYLTTKKKVDKKKDNAKKGVPWFTVAMAVGIVGLIVMMGYLQIQSKTFSTKEKHEKIDYYEILEIDNRKLTLKDIEKQFRRASMKYHPDVCEYEEEFCVDMMAKANEAYDVLVNPETRKFHDTYGVRPPETMMRMAAEKSNRK